MIVPITWSAAASTNTLRNPNKLKKERVLQVLRDANGEEVSMALLQAVAPHIGVQRPHLGAARRKPCHRNAQQRDEYGFALYRLVSESAPAQITVPL